MLRYFFLQSYSSLLLRCFFLWKNMPSRACDGIAKKNSYKMRKFLKMKIKVILIQFIGRKKKSLKKSNFESLILCTNF